MFVRYFIELPFEAAWVDEALTRDPASWLPAIAGRATSHGDDLLADVGVGERVRLCRVVQVCVGGPVRTSGKTILPISWRPTGAAAGLFPTLEADLEIAPLGPAAAHVAMSARYAPPLGAVGRALDRAILHRVAESSIKRFLDEVGEALRPLVAERAAASG